MTTTQVIPARTFRQIPGTDVDIAVEDDAEMTVTGYRSDDGEYRVEAELKMGDTITLRIPRGQQ